MATRVKIKGEANRTPNHCTWKEDLFAQLAPDLASGWFAAATHVAIIFAKQNIQHRTQDILIIK